MRRRRITQPYRQLPNFNLLPPELHQRLVSSRVLVIVLLVAVIAVGDYVLYHNWASRQQEIAQTEAQVKRLRDQLPQAQALLDQEDSLRKDIADAKLALKTAQENAALLSTQKVPWGSVTAHLLQSAPPGVTLQSFTQAVLTVGVEGIAPSYEQVVSYQRNLLDSPLIANAFLSALEPADADIRFTIAVEVKGP